MSDEFYKILLEEIRNSSSKIDNLRDFVDKKVDLLDSKIDRVEGNISKVEKECGRLEAAQAIAGTEHKRMNDLLDIHIMGVQVAYSRLEKIEEERLPALEKEAIEREALKNEAIRKETSLVQKAKKISIYIGIITTIIGTLITALKAFGLF
jgi:hypothetical protein